MHAPKLTSNLQNRLVDMRTVEKEYLSGCLSLNSLPTTALFFSALAVGHVVRDAFPLHSLESPAFTCRCCRSSIVAFDQLCFPCILLGVVGLRGFL